MKVKLTITTPKEIFFQDEVDIVTLKTPEGYIGLQANRSPFFTNIEIGKLYINFKNSDNHKQCAVGGGLVYADAYKINIITDDILYVEQIDIEKAQKEKEYALEQLKKHNDQETSIKFETKLKKALLKIEAYNSLNKK